VFDWQKENSFDWRLYESSILNEVKRYRENHHKHTKIILLIFLPLHDQASVDEKITSLKKATSQSEHSEVIKTFFLISNGYEGLKVIAKKFQKIIQENLVVTCKEAKNRVKRKQKRVMKEQLENIRYAFKNGVYAELQKGPEKGLKYYKESYFLLK